MSVVLVDVPVITATLMSAEDPQPVQIVITGLTAGQSVVVTAVTATGAEFTVPGGRRVATGPTLVLVDNRGPLNMPIRYQLLVGGATYLSGELTLTYDRHYLLQSLDGRTVARVRWLDNRDPRSYTVNLVAFAVPGRRRPPVRFAAGGDGGGELVLTTVGAQSKVLEELVLSGRPLVLRTDGLIPFVAPVDILAPLKVDNSLAGLFVQWGDTRRWTIPYLLIDDPEPSAAMAAFAWEDFDVVYAASTWGELDTTVVTNLVPNPSVETDLTGWTNGGVTLTRDTAWATDGIYSAKATPNIAGTDTYVAVGGGTGGMRLGMIAGGTYTLSATARLAAPQTSPTSAARRVAVVHRIGAGAYSTMLGTQGPNVAGEHRSAVTVTLPAGTTEALVRLYVGAGNVADNSVWWDSVTLTEGAAAGTYFDGATTDTVATTYAWTGTAHASTSTATTTTPAAGSFDAEWAGRTWDDFDAMDWGQLL